MTYIKKLFCCCFRRKIENEDRVIEICEEPTTDVYDFENVSKDDSNKSNKSVDDIFTDTESVESVSSADFYIIE